MSMERNGSLTIGIITFTAPWTAGTTRNGTDRLDAMEIHF